MYGLHGSGFRVQGLGTLMISEACPVDDLLGVHTILVPKGLTLSLSSPGKNYAVWPQVLKPFGCGIFWFAARGPKGKVFSFKS